MTPNKDQLDRYTQRNLEPGRYIDCSAYSVDRLNVRVIQFARSEGFSDKYSPDLPLDLEDRDWCASDALEFLGRLEQRDGYYWELNDNSLFLRSGEGK